jgi:hypothetical protein
MCGQLFIFIDTQVRRRNHRLLLFYALKKDLLNLLPFCVCGAASAAAHPAG